MSKIAHNPYNPMHTFQVQKRFQLYFHTEVYLDFEKYAWPIGRIIIHVQEKKMEMTGINLI